MLKANYQEKNENSRTSAIFMALASTFIIDPRVKQEVNTLSKKGFFVEVLSWDREGKNYDDIVEKNYYVKYVKKGSLIVHANDFNTIIGVFLLKLFFPNKIRTVYDSHELTPAVYSEWYGNFLGSLIGKIESKLIAYFDKIITVSPPIVKHLKQISGKSVNLIWNYPTEAILPKITKAQARKAIGYDKETFLITYVGTLRPDIALPNLIEAISDLKKNHNEIIKLSKLKIVIVGDGPLYNELERTIKHLQLENLIKLVGRVDRQTALTYLRAADLSYILFTIKGMNTTIGMPWKLFESLVSGTRVIVVKNTYAANLVRKYEAGYIVNNTDSKEISSILGEILSKDKPSELNLSHLFLWENQEGEYVNIYNTLLQNKK
ncbi:MAG: glycosyltransferase [Candidatus Heimdallarchaeota archaeon]